MSFGNVPPEMLAGAVEKLLAKMDESDLADFYERQLSAMPPDTVDAFVNALLRAFHDRGESSEDAAEEASTTLDAIRERRPAALAALVRYARGNPDLVKEATTALIERRPDLVASLPAALQSALAERLARSLS